MAFITPASSLTVTLLRNEVFCCEAGTNLLCVIDPSLLIWINTLPGFIYLYWQFIYLLDSLSYYLEDAKYCFNWDINLILHKILF